MSKTHSRAFVTLSVLTWLLAGCGQGSDALSSATNAEPPPQIQTTPAGSNAVNAPVPREKLGAALTLLGEPRYSANDDTVRVRINVANTGQVPLITEGSYPFRLGVMLIGPDGPDKAPGVRDFVRVSLPLIVPGGNTEAEAVLPAEPLLNLAVRAELVQEQVSWFGAYGLPSLELDTFQRCNGEPRTLCDATGNPIGSAE